VTAGPLPDDAREVSDPARLVSAPKVSVMMSTYRHADYIAEAIEGVLAQRADFPIELIVGDDASPDDTCRIALSYQARFPETVRVVTADANAGAYRNIRRLFARARGDYIAYCEGDDYWCAADKLARQVEVLESDPRIGAVHSDWARTRRVDGRWVVDPRDTAHSGTPRRLLEGDLFGTFYYPKLLRTCTVLYRREVVAGCFASPLGRKRYLFGDTVMAAFATASWRVGYVPRATAVYRLSPGSALRSGVPARIAHLRSCLEFDTDLRGYFGDRGDFPDGYRWETAVGLALWGALAVDRAAMRDAIADLRRHFGPAAFVREGWKSVRMRLPAWMRAF
jgi:glycosyltransferase involved in cell wall biosynthesis